MRRSGLADESSGEVFFDEFAESLKLDGRKGIDGARRRSGVSFEIDIEVIGTVRRKSIGFGVTEDISELVVLRRNRGKVGRSFRRRIGRFGGNSSKIEPILGRTREFACAGERNSVHKGDRRFGRIRRRR